MDEFKYEITERIGILNKKDSGWTLEFNMVSFNDRPPKYDIREWAPDRGSMSKGICLSKDEVLKLKELLKNIK